MAGPSRYVGGAPGRRIAEVLRNETFGGALLLGAAAIALVWANSAWSATYENLSATQIGPHVWHLDLTLAQWSADGLLAVFFFVAGLELKYELVRGSLRKISTASVPIAAAIGGMIIPAALYLAINSFGSAGEPIGWGIPMATDIAFALAVLAVAGRNLPFEVRVFLLTLAVVDDLGAILVIALFYTAGIELLPLVGAAAAIAAYGLAQRYRVRSPLVYIPLAGAIWILVHSSGVHATVAGIALGLLTRVNLAPGEEEAPAERMIHLIQPISAGLCVPLFAFFAAGVDLRGQTILETLTQPVALGIVVGLVAGKPLGIVGGAWLVTKLSRARLGDNLRWGDVIAIGLVGGVGFTVSLLIAELAFSSSQRLLTDAKFAVLAASSLSAILAAATLALRSRKDQVREG